MLHSASLRSRKATLFLASIVPSCTEHLFHSFSSFSRLALTVVTKGQPSVRPDVVWTIFNACRRDGRFQRQQISELLFTRHAEREIQLAKCEAYRPVTMPVKTSIV